MQTYSTSKSYVTLYFRGRGANGSNVRGALAFRQAATSGVSSKFDPPPQAPMTSYPEAYQYVSVFWFEMKYSFQIFFQFYLYLYLSIFYLPVYLVLFVKLKHNLHLGNGCFIASRPVGKLRA